MNEMNKIFLDFIEKTQEEISLFVNNNNHNGEKIKIEVLKAAKILHEAYQEIESKQKKSTKSKKITKKT
tara:strand:- start:185 stop:391 length:207 start_codon:yes stop_codon:yes gene_type:complete